MKIIHAADAHLGFSAYNVVDRQSGINRRALDVIESWYDFIEKALAEKPDLVLFCGDLFDLPTVPNFAIDAACALGLFDCPVLLISGNHDRAVRGDVSPLKYLAHSKNVIIASNLDKPSVHTIHGKVFSLFPSGSEGRPLDGDVLLAHGCIAGPEEYRFAGSYLEIPFANYEYVALGDLHRHLQTDNIVYPGCFSRLTFTQERVRVGFVVYDTDTKEVRHVATKSREFVTITPDKIDIAGDLLKDKIVRVLVDKSFTAVDSLYTRLSGCLHVKVERLDKDEIVSSQKADTSGELTLESSYSTFCNQTQRAHLIGDGLDLIRKNK